jgi:ribonuclease HI
MKSKLNSSQRPSGRAQTNHLTTRDRARQRSKRRIVVHVDGACSGNPGPGGWGAVLLLRKGRREIWGGESEATNNQMELLAAIRALSRLKSGRTVTVYSDSRYLVDGMTLWISGWRARGWRTASGGAVKNEELWQELDRVAAKHDVQWRWVRGHSGDALNERADALAKRGIVAGRQGDARQHRALTTG